MNDKIIKLSVFLFAFVISAHAYGQDQATLYRQDKADVNVKIYAPEKISCRGTAIISPGAGGSEAGYKYLAEFLGQNGWLAIVIGHKESGRAVVRDRMRGKGLKEGLRQLIVEPSAYEARLMDIYAARKFGTGRCNSSISALIGHSMGAATVMMEAGAKNNLGIKGKDSFDAYIAISPQGVGSIFPTNAWQEIKKPVLFLTGTRDSGLDGSWTSRLEPFNNMPPGCKWLGIIDGASHMNFAGKGISGTTEELTNSTTRAFLNNLSVDCAVPPPERGIEIRGK
jgi:predicted dienelactone hydrolase